jgi:hypothetical protein
MAVEHPSPPSIWIHRQHVDDVGPVVALSVAVAEELRGDRVAVSLVVDQNSAERVACIRMEGLEDDAEGGLSSAYVRGRFNASRAASTDA